MIRQIKRRGITKKEEKLLDNLRRLAEGCRAYPEAQFWADWFERDRRKLQAILESDRLEEKRRLLEDVRRALWGGMGVFCDGSAPNKELEKLGNRTYRLVCDLESAA